MPTLENRKGSLFYVDEQGVRQDAALHQEILDGEHEDALDVTRELLRQDGWSEQEIEDWLDTQ